MRLYVEELTSDIGELNLDPDRSHYLCRVRRAQAGDSLSIFNGKGLVARGSVADANKRKAVISVTDVALTPPPSVRLSLLLCMIKGDAADRALQKSVELGVHEVHLLIGGRSNVQHTQKRLQHLQRVVISACEQCGQNYLPGIQQAQSLSELLDHAQDQAIICLHPGAPTLPTSLPLTDTLICIGPEGGWTDEELAEFDRKGARMAGLGPLVLRAETAPLAAIAAIRSGWGWA